MPCHAMPVISRGRQDRATKKQQAANNNDNNNNKDNNNIASYHAMTKILWTIPFKNRRIVVLMFLAVLYVLSIVRDRDTTPSKYYPYGPSGSNSAFGNNQTAVVDDGDDADGDGAMILPTTEQLIDPENIPVFMKDYFEWHGQQLRRMHSDAEQAGTNCDDDDDCAAASHEYLGNHRFLVLRCAGNDRCGGLSDRLKPFPLFLWYAATTNRILFFRWGSDKPAPIETFLRPRGGHEHFWNWTVPDALMRKIEELDNGSGDNDNNNNNGNDGGGNFTRMYFDSREKWGRKNMNRIGDQSIWLVEGNEYSGGQHIYERSVNAALEAASSSTLSSTPRNNPSSSSTTTNDSSDLLFSASKLQPRDANYRNFYHNLFHATFRPSSGVERHLNAYFYDPVAAAVDENSNNNNNANVETEAGEKQYSSSLTPSSSKSWLPNPLRHNRYVVAHYRAKYPGEPYRETQNRTVLRETTIYAVECAKTRIGVVDAGVRRKETTSSPTTSARSSSSSSREVSAVYVASDTGE